MEQILLAYGPTKETVAAIMILYENSKVKVCSSDGNTDYFNIVTVCYKETSIDSMKESGFKLAKERSRRYPAQTISEADNVNDITLLANTPAQAESLLHSLE